MIKLTRVQEEIAVALARLAKTTTKKWQPLPAIRDQRMAGKVDPKGIYLRTTENALLQLKELVPQLVKNNAVGWCLTSAGAAMVEVQLGVKP